MPQWIPRNQILSEQIAQEIRDLEESQRKRLGQIPFIATLPQIEQPQEIAPIEPTWFPTTPPSPYFMPMTEQPTPTWIPERPAISYPTTTAGVPQVYPEILPVTPKPKEAKVVVPFWQRALQIFTAPFEWIDENIIKPGLSLAGTTAKVIPEVIRQPGEDFWEWKKRSWAGWETPGININVPWSDEPWRIDMKGVMELAPWLLIPGAGQVGGGIKVARGVAGIAGKLGKVGKAVGYAIEYSPWGLTEKVAGVALKGVGKGISKVSGKVGERIVGKMPEAAPPTPFVAKITKFFEESVMPARKKFEEALPIELRGRQYKSAEEVWASARKGEITFTEASELAPKAMAGGIKEQFAVKVTKEGKPVPEVPPVTPEVTLPKVELLKMVREGEGESATLAVGKFLDNGIETIETHRTVNQLSIRVANLSQANVNRINVAISRFEPEIPTVGIRLSPRVKLVEHPELQLGLRKQWEIVVDTTNLSEAEISKLVWDDFFKVIKPQGKPILTVPTGEVIPETGKVVPLFVKEEVEEGIRMIDKAAENAFVTTDSAQAFRRLLLTGELPEPHHIREFAKVFGKDFAISVSKFTKIPVSKREAIIDTLNLPRSVLASTDISATGRQGLILSLMHPTQVPKWFGRQLKALFSEKLALQMDDNLRAHPLFDEFTRIAKGYIAPLREGASLVSREETFMSSLARRLPFVRRSERAFITYLNEARLGSYEAARNAWVAQGAGETELKVLGRFVNLASGRGDLPANLNQYAPLFNTVLFSSRLQMATLELPVQLGKMLLSKNPYMRKEAAKALVTFLGGGTALVMLLKNTGTAKVELDPRSGDFGKIQIGETRVDIWRGYLQYARFIAQMLTAERKSAYGNMSKAKRDEIAWRFLQSKSSPAFGLIVDLLRGEDYMGEPLFEKTTGAIKTARNKFLPIAIQDIIDATEQSGVNGLWTAAPALLGIGVLTYVNDLVRVRQKIAREMGFQTWKEIDPKTQREIENRNAELQAAYIKLDRQVMDTAWGEWRNSGTAIEDTFRENVERATAQYRATMDGYQFREKVGDAFTARRGGYSAREKELRFEDIVKRLNIQDTAEALVSLGPEQLAIKLYNEALWGDDMYDEFGDYRFDEAEIRKQQLRQQLGEELFNYVEEYRGLKYTDFPPEYQELVRAKQVLRPYWQIKDEVLKLYGEPKTPYQEQKQQALVTKMRKRMRLQKPEIDRYVRMFYLRE